MEITAAMSPTVDLVKLWLDKFVQWNMDHEWIGTQSLIFVTPGEGLDARALELADTIGFDAPTMKVCIAGYMRVYVQCGTGMRVIM